MPGPHTLGLSLCLPGRNNVLHPKKCTSSADPFISRECGPARTPCGVEGKCQGPPRAGTRTGLADLVAPLSMSIFSSRAEMTPAGLSGILREKHLELLRETFWVILGKKGESDERFCHHKEQGSSNSPVKAL